MTKERWQRLMKLTPEGEPVTKMTVEERLNGWHFCREWDGLLVGPEKDGEWGDEPAKCRCGYENPRPNKDWI